MHHICNYNIPLRKKYVNGMSDQVFTATLIASTPEYSEYMLPAPLLIIMRTGKSKHIRLYRSNRGPCTKYKLIHKAIVSVAGMTHYVSTRTVCNTEMAVTPCSQTLEVGNYLCSIHPILYPSDVEYCYATDVVFVVNTQL
jgi:hypothetical protein